MNLIAGWFMEDGLLKRAIDTRNTCAYSSEWAKEHAKSLVIHMKADVVLSCIKKLDVRTILDVGCGSGYFVDLLSKNGYRAYGMDNSESSIEYASKYMRGIFYLDDLNNIGKFGIRVSLVTMMHVLEHTFYPSNVLKKCREIVSDKGYVIITVPNYSAVDENVKWRKNLLHNICDDEHLIAFTPDSLTEVINKSGWEVENLFTKIYPYELILNFLIAYYRQAVGKSNVKGRVVSPKYTSLLDTIVYSPLSNILLPFTKLAERNNRGTEIIAIARKK